MTLEWRRPATKDHIPDESTNIQLLSLAKGGRTRRLVGEWSWWREREWLLAVSSLWIVCSNTAQVRDCIQTHWRCTSQCELCLKEAEGQESRVCFPQLTMLSWVLLKGVVSLCHPGSFLCLSRTGIVCVPHHTGPVISYIADGSITLWKKNKTFDLLDPHPAAPSFIPFCLSPACSCDSHGKVRLTSQCWDSSPQDGLSPAHQWRASLHLPVWQCDLSLSPSLSSSLSHTHTHTYYYTFSFHFDLHHTLYEIPVSIGPFTFLSPLCSWVKLSLSLPGWSWLLSAVSILKHFYKPS